MLLSLMIIGEVFQAVDNTFELGYVEKIELGLKKIKEEIFNINIILSY